MRKLLLVLAGCYICSTSYADIGAVQVKSYLSQNLNAQIPITGMNADDDYTNLAIGLADGSKFKVYGIRYNPELGYLAFKVINGVNGHYLQITSSKPINSPVLTFLLHYKLNTDDFYRQYTILLDPVDYSDSSQSQSRQNSTSVTYRTTQKPIPVSTRRVAKVAKAKSKPQLSFESDFSSSFVRAHLANFNQDSFSYTTSEGDNLYLIARFEQMLYPKADLEISQILIGLGLENYNDLYPPNDLYESGAEIFLPKPQAVKQISSILADAYLWDYALISDQKMNMLRDMAAKFDSELVIESSILFAGSSIKDVTPNVAAMPAVKVAPAVVPPASQKSPWLDMIMAYKYQLIGGILVIMLLIGWSKKRKSNSTKEGEFILDSSLEPRSKLFSFFNRKRKIEIQNQPVFEPSFDDGITINPMAANSQRNLLDAVSTRDVHSQAKSIGEVKPEKPAFQPSLQSTVELSSKPVVTQLQEIDHELISTLEQILAFDDARDDIRYKLLELYLTSGIKDKTQSIYFELNQRLDNDDPLRVSIADVCARFAFKPDNDSIGASKNVSTGLGANNSLSGLTTEQNNYNEYTAEQTPLEFSVSSSLQANSIAAKEEIAIEVHLPEEHERIVDFEPLSPAAIETLVVTTPSEEAVDFSSERVVDFTNFSTETPPNDASHGEVVPPDFNLNSLMDSSINPLASDNSEDNFSSIGDESDEKLNLARMYYHIDEHGKAFELLSTLINDSQASENSKRQARQLITDLGLHG